MSDLVKILTGDCVEMMHGMEAESIPLAVTSPPYDQLRTYGGKLEWDFEAAALELFRVLKPGGVLCWNVNDSVKDGSETLTSCEQKIFFRRKCGFVIHDTMIFGKSNGSKPDRYRYNQVFEYVFILSKGRPEYFNPIRDKRNVTAGKTCSGKHTMRERDGSMSVRNDRKVAAEFGVRGNIWHGNTRGQEELCQALPHPAMMPKWLARDLILSWSNPGDVVLDPFAGSGTVGMEAVKCGRKAILIDRNPDYKPIMEKYCDTTPGFAL